MKMMNLRMDADVVRLELELVVEGKCGEVGVGWS